MKCALCQGIMLSGKTNLPYELGDDYLVVIKGVPALICQQCGEQFIEIKVVREVEKLVASAREDGVTLGFMKYREAA